MCIAWDGVCLLQNGTQPNTATYTTLVSACQRGGQPQRALEFVQEMHATGLEVPSFLYSTLVTAFGRAGRWRGARGVVTTMRAHGVQPTLLTFSTLIGELALMTKCLVMILYGWRHDG